MSRLRKAWEARPKWADRGSYSVVYAETSSKARYQMFLDLDDTPMTQISVRRAKHLDVSLPDEHRLVSELSPEQRSMVSHAYGCDRQGNGYRDHYCIHPGCLDMLHLAWEFGLFKGPCGEKAYGETPGWSGAFFYLTELGKLVAASMLPTYVR